MGTSPAWAGGTLPPRPAVTHGVTSGGRWIHRDVDIHRCNKPPYDSTVKAGDVWQCNNCKKKWRVKRIDGDQRDGSVWLVWEAYDNYNGIYAPGTK